MKNSTTNKIFEQQSTWMDHSEVRATWIGMVFFIAFFILNWRSGWQI